MFWRKKSQTVDKKDYLLFYMEDDGLKIEFGFEDIGKLTIISDMVLNGKVRNSCFNTIDGKIREGGLHQEADFFVNCVNKTIKPSEYSI